jgi:exopolyphosphatase/guanosine-5'-triphosphate,3'-diphosphate pyrophosphatase
VSNAASAGTVIAAIDVGTNSVHMVVARVGPNGFDVLASEKEVVRLGEGVEGMDHLTQGAIDRGVAALRHMRRIADAHGARIRAVATSAVREADNQRDFLRAVRSETGIKLEVISGTEEARLIHLGIGRSLDIARDSVLTIDIGGGSTEFCVSVRGNLRIAQSLKLGAVRMTDAFLPGGEVTPQGVKKLRAKVQSTLAPLAHDIGRIGFSRTVLSSGTNETIARVAAGRRDRPAPQSFNGFVFGADELAGVVDAVLDAESPKERLSIEGLEPKRADIIAAGAVILDETVRMLGIESLEYSDYALREGVLVDTAQRLGVMPEEPVDAAHQSAVRLAERCSVDMEHSMHVAELSARILRAVGRHYEIDQPLERMLRVAALLANCGNAISYSKHHLHSYYIIRNADLMGFSDDEIEMIALTARYHRKSPPKASHAEYGRLGRNDQLAVDLMAGVLRVATGLDRSHDQCVSEVSSSLRDKTLVLTVRHSCRSEERIELNVHTAQARADMLADYLGDEVVIRNGGPLR